jgi:extradiol dioxygenase family protein
MNNNRFHLAFPVHDLELSKDFYIKVLSCKLGRESNKWADFNLYGHQLVAHLSPEDCNNHKLNIVDGDQIPSFHFGLILEWDEWEKLYKSLKSIKMKFLINPKIRFQNQSGEQGTFFIKDPSGNVIEFKSFKDFNCIFTKQEIKNV